MALEWLLDAWIRLDMPQEDDYRIQWLIADSSATMNRQATPIIAYGFTSSLSRKLSRRTSRIVGRRLV